ncbi:MAG: homoserine kinase type II, partial [Gammaproteobacteria bacterium]
MAHYSQLSTDQVTEILDQYAVGDLSNFKVLSGGSENTNYLVTTTNAKFVLTICEQKTFPETDDLAKLLQHLAQHQFFTTQIIPNNSKEFVTAFNNKPALLKTFIEGSIIEDLPNNTLQSLGRQLAQLHNIPPPAALPLQVTYGKETFVGVEEYAKNSDFQHWLYDIRAQVLALAN